MLNIDQITQDILAQIHQASDQPKFKSTGIITSVGDGVIISNGLSEAKMGEIIMLPGNVPGVVFNLKESQVDIVALGEITHLQTGDHVDATGQILSVKCSPQLIGRVTNALLQPIDNGAAITDDQLTLPTSHGHERINHFDAGLHGRAHVLALNYARGHLLHQHHLGVGIIGDGRAVINRLQQCVRHAPN